MTKTINPALVLAHAEAWVGTPFRWTAARRGVGADCVGLLRGIWAELSGRSTGPISPPRDWADAPDALIRTGLDRFAVRKNPDHLTPGDIVGFRIGRVELGHCGILTADGGLIHANERAGVSRSSALKGRRISGAWAMVAADDAETGPPGLAVADCVAIIYPVDDGHFVVVQRQVDGALLARSHKYQSLDAALAAAEAVYPYVEAME